MVPKKANFLHIGHHEPDLPWRLRAHAHPFHEMIMVADGAQHVEVDGEHVLARAGDILLYRPGHAHEEWAERGQVFGSYFMAFECRDFPENTPLRVHDTLGRVRVLFEWIHAESRTRGPVGKEIHRGLLNALLGQYLRLGMCPAAGFVEEVHRHIMERLDQRLTLGGLAKAVGLSKFYFVRKYRKLAGRPPMEDVRLARLERARELVLATSLPLKEIAPKVGLGDIYHMSRLFRRHLATTPATLRRVVRTAS
jgi:AraC-like DNA-binding protein